MIILFRDLETEYRRNEKSSSALWLFLMRDLLFTVPKSQLSYLNINNLRSYFLRTENGRITILAMGLSVPSILFLGIALYSQFLSPSSLNNLQNSILYHSLLLEILVKWLPLCSLAVSTLGIIYLSLKQKVQLLSISFIRVNLILMIIVTVASLMLIFLQFHDSVQCFSNFPQLTANLIECLKLNN